MSRRSDRKAEAELKLRPEPPAKRKKVSRLKITGLGVAARIVAILALICMFLPWLNAPGFEVISQFSWVFGLYIARSDYLFFMFNTGEVADLLDVLTGAGLYTSVWSVFFIFWCAGVLLLVVRFVQSVLGLRDTRRLELGGFMAGGVAIAWAIAILVLNVQYMGMFEASFGMRFTMFEVPPAVFLTAVFGIVCGILARKDRNQPFITQ